MGSTGKTSEVSLPSPDVSGRSSLAQAITRRRSVRNLASSPLAIEHISQLCWAGQGITEPSEGLRAAPSAGGLFPIELYVVRCEGIDHYLPAEHRLRRHLEGDVRAALQRAALDQEMIGAAPVCFVIATVVKRLARRYGARAERYSLIEVGHVAQNMLLQVTALGLASVPVAAFDEGPVGRILKLPNGQQAIYLLPVGHPGD